MDDVVRVAALVSCNLGLSAFEWTKQNRFITLSIECRGVRTLALGHAGVLGPMVGGKLFLARCRIPGVYTLLASNGCRSSQTRVRDRSDRYLSVSNRSQTSGG